VSGTVVSSGGNNDHPRSDQIQDDMNTEKERKDSMPLILDEKDEQQVPLLNESDLIRKS
jgi:hypothetical protein